MREVAHKVIKIKIKKKGRGKGEGRRKKEGKGKKKDFLCGYVSNCLLLDDYSWRVREATHKVIKIKIKKKGRGEGKEKGFFMWLCL